MSMSQAGKIKDIYDRVHVTVNSNGNVFVDLSNYALDKPIIDLEDVLERMPAYAPFSAIEIKAENKNIIFNETDFGFLAHTDVTIKCANYLHKGNALNNDSPLAIKSLSVECKGASEKDGQLSFRDATRLQAIKQANFKSKQIVVGSSALSNIQSHDCQISFTAPLIAIGQGALCDNNLSGMTVGDKTCEFLLYHENSMLPPYADYLDLNHFDSMHARYFGNRASTVAHNSEPEYITTCAKYPFKAKTAERLSELYDKTKSSGHAMAARENPYTPNYMSDSLGHRELGVRPMERDATTKASSMTSRTSDQGMAMA